MKVLQAVIFLLATLALRAVGRADVQTQAFVQNFTQISPLVLFTRTRFYDETRGYDD